LLQDGPSYEGYFQNPALLLPREKYLLSRSLFAGKLVEPTPLFSLHPCSARARVRRRSGVLLLLLVVKPAAAAQPWR
jgi:hypothetical protein